MIGQVRNAEKGGTTGVLSSLRSSAWVGVTGGALLVALGAHVRIPLLSTPVPMTLQLLAVLAAGFLLSPRRAAAAMVVYAAAGIAGLPVFAPASGGFVGITGGYIVGFVPAVWVVSALSGRSSYLRLVGAATAGAAIVLSCGVAWAALFFGRSLTAAFTFGFAPFLLKAVVEVLWAATAASVFRARCGSRR